MQEPVTNPANPALSRRHVIKVFGVGGGGCNAVSHMARAGFDGVQFTAMNTDASALAQSPVANKLILGEKLMRGLGAGGDPDLGRAAAEEARERISELCKGADIVFIAAGLGGGTGTGAGPVIARLAKESGALVLGTVMLPFECEGSKRQRQALLGLHELKNAADGVICLPNQKLLKLIDEKTSVIETFKITNELLAQSVRGIWRLLTQPGLINVDFADLCAVTRGRHSESTLATAEAHGEHRAREVVEKLMAHPLLDGGQPLADAESVLVSLAGGADLTMAEVNRVMEQISRHCEHAHIIMGASVGAAGTDGLAVTLVASRPAGRSEAPVARGTQPLQSAPASGLSKSETEFITGALTSRPASRFVPPAPFLTQERTEQLLTQGGGSAGRARKGGSRLKQGQLPLEILSKGRFEKSEPTLYHGQDLDVPTYVRRGVPLN